MREHIAQFLSLAPRGKVVFAERLDAHLQPVDVGLALSAAIEKHLGAPALPQIGEDALRKIFAQSIKSDLIIGPYLALSNWGILFEPALNINMLALFDQYDKNQTLILENCGVVENNRFYLCDRYSNYSFPIGELNPYILQA